MWRAVRQHEELKERHRKDTKDFEGQIDKFKN